MNAKRLMCVAVALVVAGSAFAAPVGRPGRHAKPLRVAGKDAKRIDGNNISMVITNTGSFAYDKVAGSAGLEFPKGTGKTAVFAAGLWLGAKVGGKVRIALSEYSDEYGPGAVNGTGAGALPDDPASAYCKVFKLSKSYADPAVRDADLLDYTTLAVPKGAPAVTLQTDGTLDIPGDQMCWAVYNDLAQSNHTNTAGHTLPLGVEIQQTTWVYNRQGALGNAVFIKYKIINRGANQLDNMFVSQWSDPDLGGFTDDLVGCDVGLSTGFVYNATNNDEQYGGQPPCVGYDFLQGPKVGTTVLGLASFNKYPNGGGPQDSLQTYNYMTGADAGGNPVIDPTTGLTTTFNVPGDPVTGTGWLDTAPSDRRLMLSSGPFSMAPNDVQEVVVGIVIGQSKNRLASISLMKFYDQAVQATYDANFNVPSPPVTPGVTASARNGSVFLSWDARSEVYNVPPYLFEGYIVYQGASIAGPWTPVATYDRPGGATIIYDLQFDEDFGVIVSKPVINGSDVGLRYKIELTDDAVKGGPIYVGTPYFFTVTAYAYGAGQFPQALESAFNPITVVPQTPSAGTDWSSAGLGATSYSQVVANPVSTTDQVVTSVVDADKVITADYQVGFKPACKTCANTVWYVVRNPATTADTVVNNWTNVSLGTQYAADFPVVDGVQIQVLSKPLGNLARVAYVDVGPNPPALDGADRGLEFFSGGSDYAANDLGGTIAAGSVGPNVEIRFTTAGGGQNAYRYLRELLPPVTGVRVYQYQDYVPVPFTVWDIDANQQLNAGFLENAGPPPAPNQDGTWDPSTAGDGGREIVWVMGSNYSGASADPFYNVDLLGGALDLRYEFSSRLVATGAVIDPGDKIVFATSIPNTPNDVFSFSTTAPNRTNAAMAKNEMDKIKAVPNPYFAHSAYELTQFSRILKFTHLPANCTIRLFNLAGELVRTIQKNDNTSEATWNLNSDGGLPVASGIYIYHITAPAFGKDKVGKVAIFMEKERLNNY